MRYLALFAIVFGINLLPAFGPPTWAVLVFTRLHWHLKPIALVLLGAVAAMSGRYLLARGARYFKGRMPNRMKDNLEDARILIEASGWGRLLCLGSSWCRRCRRPALPCGGTARPAPRPTDTGLLPRSSGQLLDLRERGHLGRQAARECPGADLRFALGDRAPDRSPGSRLPSAVGELAALPGPDNEALRVHTITAPRPHAVPVSVHRRAKGSSRPPGRCAASGWHIGRRAGSATR